MATPLWHNPRLSRASETLSPCRNLDAIVARLSRIWREIADWARVGRFRRTQVQVPLTASSERRGGTQARWSGIKNLEGGVPFHVKTHMLQRKTGSASDTASASSSDAKSTAGHAPESRTITLHTNLGHVGTTLANDPELLAVYVQHVHPNDLAARAGLRPGDVIVALNETPVRDHADAVERMNAAVAKKEVLAVTFLPATQAEDERQRVRTRTEPRRRYTWAIGNAILILVVFFCIRAYYSNSGFGFGLSSEEWERMQHLALDEARLKLSMELSVLGQQAANFGSNGTALLDLEVSSPQIMIQMLRAATYLNQAMLAEREGQLQ